MVVRHYRAASAGTFWLNDQFQEWIRQRVAETYTEDQIANNPRYTDEHFEMFHALADGEFEQQ